MSLRSMTGFGSGRARGGGVRIEVELSATNRKQLDISLSLPPQLRVLEARLIKVMAAEIRRGRVNGEVRVVLEDPTAAGVVVVNTALAAEYVRRLRAAGRSLGVAGDVDLRMVASLPGVVAMESVKPEQEGIEDVVEQALRRALRALVRMRIEEGRAMSRQIRALIEDMGTRVERIAKRAPQVARKYRKLLRERISRLGVELDGRDAQIEREVVFFAERSDISEELVRLRSHLSQAVRKLSVKDPVGRTLDFLAQEMYREINTIGSKAGDGMIAREVVEFKAELEKFREQVQNVE